MPCAYRISSSLISFSTKWCEPKRDFINISMGNLSHSPFMGQKANCGRLLLKKKPHKSLINIYCKSLRDLYFYKRATKGR